MKKSKRILKMVIVIFAFAILVFACREGLSVIENKPSYDYGTMTSLISRDSQINDTMSINIQDGDYLVSLNGSFRENEIVSSLIVREGENTVFEISYDFNVNEEHWRLKQHKKVVQKAIGLANISPRIIENIQNILNSNVSYIYHETLDVKNLYLVSLVNYYNSILNTRVRANNNNTDCKCRVTPEFLIEKSFFNCQEDQSLEVSELKQILVGISENVQLDQSSIALLDFLNNTSEQIIDYPTYYDFYLARDDYDAFIENYLQNDRNCSKWCPIGCGTDHGCCGNYQGCCLYRHVACLIHDGLCTNCKPAYFCLPGCKPDVPRNSSYSVSIY